MNNESSQAEAGVKVKAKDAKEEAEKLKAEVKRAKKKLGRLEKDNNGEIRTRTYGKFLKW